MQGEGVENKEFLASFQKETFHKVGLIDVGASLRHLRQVPSGNRRLTPHALAGIEHAVPLENAVNGCYRGNIGLALFEEISTNGFRPELAQVAVLRQETTRIQYALLGIGNRLVGNLMGRMRTIFPGHMFEFLSVRAFYPVLHGCRTHAELSGGCTQRLS